MMAAWRQQMLSRFLPGCLIVTAFPLSWLTACTAIWKRYEVKMFFHLPSPIWMTHFVCSHTHAADRLQLPWITSARSRLLKNNHCKKNIVCITSGLLRTYESLLYNLLDDKVQINRSAGAWRTGNSLKSHENGWDEKWKYIFLSSLNFGIQQKVLVLFPSSSTRDSILWQIANITMPWLTFLYLWYIFVQHPKLHDIFPIFDRVCESFKL